MSVVMMIDNPNGSPELYARMVEQLHPPVGGIAHIAGPGPEGGWRVLEVWDSEDEARRFLRERFAPALRAAGAQGPPPAIQFWPVHAMAFTAQQAGKVPAQHAEV
jgi:hypothetical protein